jgi:hypothetical protein
LRAAGEPVTVLPLAVALRGRDDLPFLEVAHAGRVGALVTGDRSLAAAGRALGVPALAPARFLERLAGESTR